MVYKLQSKYIGQGKRNGWKTFLDQGKPRPGSK